MYELKLSVEALAERIKSVEEHLILAYSAVKERVVTQSFMSENMPKVIEGIINGDFTDVTQLKAECRKLIDSCKLSADKKIELEFRPEKSLEGFRTVETQFVKQIKALSITFSDQFRKLEKLMEQVHANSYNPLHDLRFSPTLKAPTITLENHNRIAL